MDGGFELPIRVQNIRHPKRFWLRFFIVFVLTVCQHFGCQDKLRHRSFIIVFLLYVIHVTALLLLLSKLSVREIVCAANNHDCSSLS